jgi:hypothetical protein
MRKMMPAVTGATVERIKLTIHHLHKIISGEKQDAQATARIYAGDELLLTETMTWQAMHFDRFIQAENDNGKPLRVEWDSDGSAAMSVSRAEVCPCCGGDALHH